jgi:DNA-binding transcriptional ArsR family regulator
MDEKILELLNAIKDLLLKIDKRLEKIEKSLNGKKKIADPFTLLEMPDNLRVTAMAVLELKEATAEEVAKITGRGRAIESHYLNTLVRMGFLRKKRVGRRVVYYRQ